VMLPQFLETVGRFLSAEWLPMLLFGVIISLASLSVTLMREVRRLKAEFSLLEEKNRVDVRIAEAKGRREGRTASEVHEERSEARARRNVQRSNVERGLKMDTESEPKPKSKKTARKKKSVWEWLKKPGV
jgi:hypothetical protein